MKFSKTFGLIAALSIASPAQAVLIDFTGGTVTTLGGTTFITDTTAVYDDVDFYEQNGVKFDFLGPSANPFSYNIGNYYSIGNDVIHGHWTAGPFGDLESIRVEKIDGTAFDLNYVKVTTNTNTGGGPASGTEEVFINALADGVNVSHSELLPSDDWGFAGPNSEIFFGSEFDGIKAFTFTYGSGAVGLGLDEFFIDEEPPRTTLEPSTILGLITVVCMGIALKRQLSFS